MTEPRFADIVWDWNGTLLDDVDLSIEIVNGILARRGRGPTDRERYFRDFEMPVARYYENAGLDPAVWPFEDIAAEFADAYRRRVPAARLADGALGALEALRGAGVRQSIVSSSEREGLLALTRHFGIDGYFAAVVGKDDHRGEGKEGIAAEWLARSGAEPGRTLLVGDLLYDAEVAASIGCACVLIGRGHQGRDKIARRGVDVLESVGDVPAYVGITDRSGKP